MGSPEARALIHAMSFENLRVYQASELLDRMVLALIATIGVGHGKDVDHLKRAASAIRANIAEAWGSITPGLKIYHLGIARGSADEVRAVLRRLVDDEALTEHAIKSPSILSRTIAKMLTALIEKIQEDL